MSHYKPKVIAVILNYNSSDDARRCLGFLKKQTYDNLGIILVDNASTCRNERIRIRNICRGENILFVQNETNRGFSAGNNVGLRMAVELGAQWCLVINPDVELRNPEWLKSIIETVENYPKAAVIGTDVRMPDQTRQNPMRECTYMEDLLWPLDAMKHKFGLWKGYLAEDKTGYCDKLSGCSFLIRADFLQEIGFLDEHNFLYSEEPILAIQVRLKGYRELYIKEVTAFHQHFESKKGANGERMVMMVESRMYYLKKYSGYQGIGLKLLLFSKKLQRAFWKSRIKRP